MKNDEVKFSIYLDRRYTNSEGKHVVKLRLYDPVIKKTKLYSTNITADVNEFNAIRNEQVRGSRKEKKEILYEIERRTKNIIKELQPFTFSNFEDRMFRKSGDDINVKAQYVKRIAELKRNDQISSANSYELSLKSIKNYYSGPIEDLTFYDIDVDFLKGYEKFYKHKSVTTIAIYLRVLRAIFNRARKNYPPEVYPFTKDKYTIPKAKVKKTPLTQKDLRTLFNAQSENLFQEKARDFWFLSYLCSGINIKDMALLRAKDINFKKRTITFFRAKTQNTSRELEPIIVHLNDYAVSLIKKYAVDTKYVFNIIDVTDDEVSKHRKIKAFTRFINQHIQKLAKSAGMDFKISVQWARHAYATISIRKGASIEFISEALGHANIRTTQHYLDGFTDEAMREHADGLMDFAYGAERTT